MRGTSIVKRLIISLLICEAIMAVSAGVPLLMAGRASAGPETIRFLKFAVGVGIPVALVSFGICGSISAKSGYIIAVTVGGVVGLLTSVLSGYTLGNLADIWIMGWGHHTTPLDTWVSGLLLAVPSAIAGAAIGWLQARFEVRSTPQ
jgi:hypothetical protein